MSLSPSFELIDLHKIEQFITDFGSKIKLNSIQDHWIKDQSLIIMFLVYTKKVY